MYNNLINNVFQNAWGGGVIGLAILGAIVNMTMKLFNLQNTTIHISISKYLY